MLRKLNWNGCWKNFHDNKNFFWNGLCLVFGYWNLEIIPKMGTQCLLELKKIAGDFVLRRHDRIVGGWLWKCACVCFVFSSLCASACSQFSFMWFCLVNDCVEVYYSLIISMWCSSVIKEWWKDLVLMFIGQSHLSSWRWRLHWICNGLSHLVSMWELSIPSLQGPPFLISVFFFVLPFDNCIHHVTCGYPLTAVDTEWYVFCY